jgi:hypothetical protein
MQLTNVSYRDPLEKEEKGNTISKACYAVKELKVILIYL